MIDLAMACVAVVISTVNMFPVDLSNIEQRDHDKCKEKTCYIMTHEEVISTLKRARRSGQMEGVQEEKLRNNNYFDKLDEQCKNLRSINNK